MALCYKKKKHSQPQNYSYQPVEPKKINVHFTSFMRGDEPLGCDSNPFLTFFKKKKKNFQSRLDEVVPILN